MRKDIVLQHKLEKERFIAKSYIFREKLNFARNFLRDDLIKIITGPRRAGKSVFAILLLKDENFAYLNFDDENLLKATNYDEILKTTLEVYPESKFIFFDEIQNLENWELFVNKLHRRGYNLILTGSNAKLLSQELATVLTGRYVSVEVFPFSFKEFLDAKNFQIKDEYIEIPEVRGKILNYLEEYVKNGGFPEIIVKGVDTEIYLETLFDAILFKDIVKRYKVRFPQKIYDLAIYLISNFCAEFSFTKIKNILEFRSTYTVQNYFNYLQEAYLFFALNRFSFKMKEQIKAPKKVYLTDNGFIMAKAFQFSSNTGKLMENLIFIDFLKRGYKVNESIFYYKTRNGKEVDFILREGLKINKLIQVCLNIEDIKVKKREEKSLIEASGELKCDDLVIITWDIKDEVVRNNKKIKLIPLWKWLLMSEKSD
jgi:predicted AAA+ superfamily ATPase